MKKKELKIAFCQLSKTVCEIGRWIPELDYIGKKLESNFKSVFSDKELSENTLVNTLLENCNTITSTSYSVESIPKPNVKLSSVTGLSLIFESNANSSSIIKFKQKMDLDKEGSDLKEINELISLCPNKCFYKRKLHCYPIGLRLNGFCGLWNCFVKARTFSFSCDCDLAKLADKDSNFEDGHILSNISLKTFGELVGRSKIGFPIDTINTSAAIKSHQSYLLEKKQIVFLIRKIENVG